LFSGQLSVMEDRAQEPRWDIFTAMDRYDRRAPIGMPQIEVTALLSDSLKPQTFKETNELGGLEDGKLAHEETLTCWIPTN